MKNSKLITKKSGFTIVELLVVIVVIGIMAAIVTVSYIGITGKAVSASLQSDLVNAKGDILIFQAEKGVFPDSINDCPNLASNKMCFNKYSSGNSLTYYQADNTSSPKTFSLYVSNSNGISYKVISKGTPTAVSKKSCFDILNANESTGSGIYYIKPIGTVFPVYCDMVTSGGGWTLIVSNPGPYTSWNLTSIYSLNSNTPSITSLYSILNKADTIKSNISGNLQYRIDAVSIGRWGGVWQAPFANTFTGTTVVNNATNIEKYDIWTIDTTNNDTSSLSNIMPWIANNTQLLSTWGNAGSWWGTLVTGSSGWIPAPYMAAEKPGPGAIWYWVK